MLSVGKGGSMYKYPDLKKMYKYIRTHTKLTYLTTLKKMLNILTWKSQEFKFNKNKSNVISTISS